MPNFNTNDICFKCKYYQNNDIFLSFILNILNYIYKKLYNLIIQFSL